MRDFMESIAFYVGAMAVGYFGGFLVVQLMNFVVKFLEAK